MIEFSRRVRAGLRMWALRELYRSVEDEKTSKARALRLLREWLSPQQREQFDARGHFDVFGSDTGRRYRIRRGTSANVQEIDSNGRVGMGWCFVPAGGLVEGDVMLAQKVALETDELATLAVANRFPPLVRWSCPTVRPF